MQLENCKVKENKKIARDTYKMKIQGSFVQECKSPGQFINIKIGSRKEFMLRRPISISEINKEKNEITIIFKINGEGTEFLSKLSVGSDIDVIAPLGKGYDIASLERGETALLVGGGIGVPPLYELAKQFHEKGVAVITILGFNNVEDVFYEEEFSKFGKVYVATADGSYKTKGFVTDILKQESLVFDKFYSCGPLAMLKALTNFLTDKDGYISIENRMACGVGACYACVCKKAKNGELETYNEDKVAYTRVCYDGPVYRVGTVVLE